ncbi:synaptotagmin-like protein 4 isoform X1 [Poeciliopsis prolifica]|uniref:synaptotagmin-like protein 4 isoform X1 n=1 Tax=Poeciliopsis prolifica TaxID=188132 RepID=UPI0024136C84|nr:synaptotagmin-like protein 4 isoform X1 [Poeciliopsis prolifica]XP_054886893.1 synaptotagmin-like protein 4 isoform X1 [Poeciliopsis prolifica]XP_054886894.1 synaptotagmin-like protein 4 isoform X1 [Poeciliopsis prolifica]XP_054887177.1 synaptotagmin-like protein 4 isoform X1 [Poeciliopsis prolifica]XP_054887178.1 synaptotagmin-like protein 4 isoform X1 [Poeciliopsis prolifica]XP_054887179.1 synaptotagmin-like protein 4 isoform X1 [Poeciliopsis prolifica]
MPEAPDLINLGFLSDSERELILEVLRRDEELRMVEDKRVRKLKSELLEVKRKGAKRGGESYSERSCGRCQEPLRRLSVFSNQCKICNHYVCRNCQAVLPNGSWLCNVCIKETDVKKRTGDWFYDQRVNRFSMNPGHDLVRVSLKKRPAARKRETTGEKLLRTTVLPQPVPLPRQKNPPVNTDQSSENSGSIASMESLEPKDNVSAKPLRSDTESAENISIFSAKTETESGRATPEQLRAHSSVPPSPAASSPTAPGKTDVVRTGSGSSNTSSALDVKPLNASFDLEVERLFKKSVKIEPKPKECSSTLELREEPETSMGKRSRSVPGLDIQEDEEEEDIDRLVNFHKMSMARSTSSLQSSKSMMSIYSESGDFDSVEVSGDVVFSLKYDEHTQSLHVFIKQCNSLAYADASRLVSNPYVKCYLLPDKSRQSKRKTSIKKNTINPVYNETMKYSIVRSQLVNRSLLMSVWHSGRLSRNAFLGEVQVPLDCKDLESGCEEQMALMGKVGSVVPASPFAQYKGELVISLKYVTPKKTTAEKVKGKKAPPVESGELHVLIKEAKNLMAMKPGGTSDSFVKGYLFPSKTKSAKKKTDIVKKNLNPQYNSTFVYKELSLEQLREMCLELTVWDREAMLSNEFLGGVRLSSGKGAVKIGKQEVELESVGEEISLWQKMMQYPDSWAEGTLPLRSSMGKTKGK